MSSLSEKMEHKQVRYRAFLERRMHSCRGWQSFNYYSDLYLKLFNETSNSLIQFLLLDDFFFESEQAVLKLLDSFFDQLVRAYDLKFHEDFEKNVYFEKYPLGISKVN